jgi:hypothetical protein
LPPATHELMENKEKIILDLCGGTAAWSKPYKDAGYDVRVITTPEYDVRTYKYETPENVYGILAAPPCTMFSFARTNAKTPRDLKEGMECVRSCLYIIWSCMEIQQDTKKKTLPLRFWALENPYFGLLKSFLGKPAFVFDPWEFGDGYQKKTALWGNFNEPEKQPVPMTDEMKELAKTNSYLHRKKFDYLKSSEIHPEQFGKMDRQTRRAITPAGFAKAFFQKNK